MFLAKLYATQFWWGIPLDSDYRMSGNFGKLLSLAPMLPQNILTNSPLTQNIVCENHTR